ncbi:MAG: hypothetical protein COX62_00345 [Deltaproteobacteria bacterium CG_4_10_14_0_2_um_filter_43_8]|nr:MAG: hypothetical protein COV43_03605 [Deltaproteobacteria bacterium CG11_big_fil_rev_8_21_14_0_20_42_23]PJA22272.1 MAG: hypothetical protein COX62_00345 [Deltaproteobacteria bacterium CG_4_10_14_0_2_um_filter_43_8]PJC63513.1 MAG: hypothetical protein CO021_09265 [Deltaproteobacteria bacterium CG_4_9_14_0_2_um_filter_42_21]
MKFFHKHFTHSIFPFSLLIFLFISQSVFADAVLIDVSGDVSAKLKKDKLAISIGSTLPDATVLSIGEKSSASLMYMNGELVSLKENECVTIGEKIKSKQVKSTTIIPGLASALEEVKHIKGENSPTLHGRVKMGNPQSGPPQGLVLGGAFFGVDGISPTHSRIFSNQKKIIFKWKLEGKTKLNHPYLVIEDEHQKPFYSSKLTQNQNQFSLYSPLQKLKPGKKYFWYLSEKKGKQLHIKGARYWFQLLNSNDEKNLNAKLKQLEVLQLSPQASALLKAQVYYQFDLFHAMVDALEPVMKQKPNPLAQNLLFLAHLRMGHSKQVEEYREKK